MGKSQAKRQADPFSDVAIANLARIIRAMSFSASTSKILVVLMAVAQTALAIEQRILPKDADAQEVAPISPEQLADQDGVSSKNQEQEQKESKSGTQVQAAPSLFGDRGVTTPGFTRLSQLSALAFELSDGISLRSRICWLNTPALQPESHWSVRVTASADLSQAPPTIL